MHQGAPPPPPDLPIPGDEGLLTVTVEFACEDGIPYAIDFMNPAPDADINSVGPANFDWIVNQVSKLAMEKARNYTGKAPEYRWSAFLGGTAASSNGQAAKQVSQEVRG